MTCHGVLAQISQETSAQSTAGGAAQSSSFSMIATVGQSNPPGEANATSVSLESGFLFFLQDTLGDMQAPMAPSNVNASPSTWTNVNNFSITWTNPEPDANIAGVWYKVGSAPVSNDDGIYSAGSVSILSGISVSSSGMHNVYIWLQDIMGNRSYLNNIEVVVKYDDQIPNIEHTEVSSTPVGNAINIEITASDDHSQIAEEWLYFRKTGDINSLDSVTFSSGIASIPASINTQRGCQYAIVARDSAGNIAREPIDNYYSVQAELAGQGGYNTNNSGQPIAQHQGSSVNDYRIFSIPFELNNKMVSSVFEDDLGSFDDTQWLLFDINNGSLRDYNTIRSQNLVEPGKGFLLIVNKPDIVIDGGSGSSSNVSTFSQLQLNAGWTLIGNPFDFDIPLNNLSVDSEIPEAWYLSNSGWQNNPTHLKKWEGLAIRTINAAILNIIPAEGEGTIISVADQFNEDNWGIQLIARGEESVDRDNYVGMYNSETISKQRRIWHEAPRLKNAISLSLKPDDQIIKKRVTTQNEKLSSYIKPFNEQGYCWDIEVRGDKNGEKVNINFEQLSDIPKELSKYLVDVDIRIAYDLDEIKWAHQIKTTANKSRHLKLVIGDHEFVQNNSDGISLIADEYTLRQNFPNPFNPHTTIIFSLPKSEEVQLEIFNTLGQKVKSLITGDHLDAGFHSIEWNGLNNRGQSVATGVYIYRLTAGNVVKTKKAILTR
jgi:hypothetical protein